MSTAITEAPRPALFPARDRIACLLLFLVSFLTFVPWAGFPADYNFDETHYVIAAKLLVPPQVNINWEHPPLAKWLMGLGIALAGDTPFGWRLGSMIFGGLVVAGMYAWGLGTFRERGLALWVALASLLNMMVFVMARTAMLDIFMLAFLIWGLAAVSGAWDAQRPDAQVRALLVFAGAMFGLATACKWVGIVPAIFVVLLWAVLRLLQAGGARFFAGHGEEPWYTAATWESVGWVRVTLYFVVIPLAVYGASQIPLLWLPGVEGTWKDVLILQRDMAHAQATLYGPHHYASNWYQWPFDWKPIWFYFRTVDGWTRGILLIGNPLLMLPGFLAVLLCTWVWWERRTRESFLCVVWYWLLFLCFAVIPRKISFFHYYLPAACALSLPLAYIFRHYGGPPLFRRAWGRWAFLALLAAVFLLFYPVLVGLPLPADFSPQ